MAWSKLLKHDTIKSISTLSIKDSWEEKEHNYTLRPILLVFLVFLYVDDLIYTRNNTKMMMDFKKDMMETFEMTDLALIS